MSSTLPEELEELLRAHLPDLGADQQLRPDEPLLGLGLDSVRMVALIVDMESVYSVSLPEGLMSAETFHSARTLHQALVRCGAVAPAV
jgi:aryl carrier-like protein